MGGGNRSQNKRWVLATIGVPVMVALAMLQPGSHAVPAANAEASGASPTAFSATYEVLRLAGPDRYATAVEVSKELFDPGVEAVTIAYGGNFPDALAAGPMAALWGPLLLVRQDSIPAVVGDELERLDPGHILIVGGESVVSAATESALQSYVDPGNVLRFAGPNRYATAAEIAWQGWGTADEAYLATGQNFPDALSAGPVAAWSDAPLLLTPSDYLHQETAWILEDLGVQSVTIAGGDGAVNPPVVRALQDMGLGTNQVAGDDRYQTAAGLVGLEFTQADVVFLATGRNFPDALGGGAAAGYYGYPLLLTKQECLPQSTAATLQQLDPEVVVVLGGEAVVSDTAAFGQVCPD